MAAKKNTSKPAPEKGEVSAPVKSSKPKVAAKKPEAAVAKAAKPAPVKAAKAEPKKTVSGEIASLKKAAPAIKPEPVKKPTASSKASSAIATPATKAAKTEKAQQVPVVSTSAKTAEPAVAPKVSPPTAPVAVAKKVAATKPRSSVVDFPAPPAPIKPPFVPPKSSLPPLDGPVTPGSNGTHSPAFVLKQKQRLLDLRDDLVDAVSGMARDTIRNAPEGSEASGSGQHQGDAGSDAYDRDFALSVLAKEQDALYEIEQALRRIQSGSYGICEMSARKIPQARLEVIPFARLTVECQAQWEKEYGNRRFRPSNEVGFSGGKYAEDEDSETVSLDEDDD